MRYKEMQKGCVPKVSLSLVGIMVLGLVARLGVLFFLPDPNFPDAQLYEQSGRTLALTGRFPSDLHMPLYPLWGWVMGSRLIVQVADVLLSTLSLGLIYALAVEMFKNRCIGLIAAAIGAVYPHFIFYASSRLTETSFIFFMLLGFLLFYRSRFFWGSVVFVLSLLIRPTFDLLIPVLIVVFSLVHVKVSWPVVLKRLGIYAVVYSALLAPWWVHNYQKFGTFVRFNLGDVFVLYSGNNPMNRSGGGVINGGPDDDLDLKIFEHLQDPIERHHAMKAEALKFISENPQRFFELAGLKFLRFWRLWPYAPEHQSIKIILTSLFSYGSVLLLSLIFVLTRLTSYWREVLPPVLTIGYLTLVHMITIGSIRYRLPIEPFLILFAAVTLKFWIGGKVLYDKNKRAE